MSKDIILLLTHKYNKQVENKVQKLFEEKGRKDFCLLFHGQKKNFTVPNWCFTNNDLASLGYRTLGKQIVPGNVHHILLKFFKDFPNFDHYWFIEYDVEFGGHWQTLFKEFDNNNTDFISTYIKRYKNDPHWPWWNLSHPSKHVPNSQRIRSFNPIFRISKNALQYLHKELLSGWKGHNEVLLPTLLYHNNFSLEDLSRRSEFSMSNSKNYYTENWGKKKYLQLGTMRYRPAMKKIGIRKMLYHPVKYDVGLTRFEEIKFKIKEIKKRYFNH